MREATPAEAKLLDPILTDALKKTFPVGAEVNLLSQNDRIGTLILLKVVRHLAGSRLDPDTKLLCSIVFATVGASTGMRPTQSSVALLDQLN